MKNNIFIFAYAFFGAFLTSSSFIVHRSDLLLENPFLIFIISFLSFFSLSFFVKHYFDYVNSHKISLIPLKIISFLMILFVIGLLTNLLLLTNKNFLNEDVYSLPERLKNLSSFNWWLTSVAIALLIGLYSLLSYFIIGKNKLLENLKAHILFTTILLSLIPLSVLLEKLFRIIILIIELSGGL